MQKKKKRNRKRKIYSSQFIYIPSSIDTKTVIYIHLITNHYLIDKFTYVNLNMDMKKYNKSK
ncbi:hypothetical protein HanIR_Chr13g0657471 [Helianthus annuus]|nr:hypothetical protein HanIR_Chr13g0657471 [Helianthus annuus]